MAISILLKGGFQSEMLSTVHQTLTAKQCHVKRDGKEGWNSNFEYQRICAKCEEFIQLFLLNLSLKRFIFHSKCILLKINLFNKHILKVVRASWYPNCTKICILQWRPYSTSIFVQHSHFSVIGLLRLMKPLEKNVMLITT